MTKRSSNHRAAEQGKEVRKISFHLSSVRNNMKYRFIDGYEFEAEGPEAICTTIWKSMKFSWETSLEEWMAANARVMQNAYGHKLRYDSPEHHVADMLRTGVIEAV